MMKMKHKKFQKKEKKRNKYFKLQMNNLQQLQSHYIGNYKMMDVIHLNWKHLLLHVVYSLILKDIVKNK